MDVAKLLEPHGDDTPSGENLEYDPEFVEMELAAQPGEERQEGDKILEAEDPDFADVVKKAEVILGRSHDIRAAVFYAEAVLHGKGIKGFADAVAFVRGCLETHWDTCHPELDEDDDNDPTMRINAVQGLNGTDTVIKSLRRASLTNSRMFGQMSLRMIEAAEGIIAAPAGTDVPDSASVGAAFQDTDSEELSATLAAAIAAQADLKAIDAVFVEKTPGQGPELEEVQKTLTQIVRRLSDALGSDGLAAVEGAEPEEGDAPAAAAAPAMAAAPAGSINSQSDVTNALDRIIMYYQRNEPSSPMPILLERAKKLVGADFMEIMTEIAPQGLEQVKMVGGIRNN